ncbi:ABC transporter substrate-binding protein [Halocella sp. SP3-1]|uniref:ABC transporter substrate-binding protein n=1 Tax=Halocella sp. SP3-1 TaxID=2382161 RepID=UPI000F762758|nr:ABC transporter substrate-binding protein [Halocella sp. SP3-1]AZO96005.1 hypothetical protein D7D81_16195 [Halocella sp. SP3-1]
MLRVFLHNPLNIGRPLADMVKKYCRQIEDKHGMDIKVYDESCHHYEEDWLIKSLTNDQIADMTLTYGIDFGAIRKKGLVNYFEPLPNFFNLREELATNGFIDSDGFLHPVFLVPFIIIYNKNMSNKEEVPSKWEEIVLKSKSKVILPEKHLPLTRAILSFLEYMFPDDFPGFLERCVFFGTPMDVKNKVDNGEYTLGITNVSFARFARQKNIEIVWPVEGAICMPLVMSWGRGVDKRLLELGNYLLSPSVQEFFVQQGFIPAVAGVSLPAEAADNNCNLVWEGWDRFLEINSKK